MTDLDAYALDNGIDVFYDEIPQSQAIAVPGAVCLDWSLLPCPAARSVCLAHELGHVETGTFYTRDASDLDRRRAELRAERWAIRHLISRVDLLAAICDGCRTPWEFSEYFNLPERVVRSALSLYLVCH